MTAMGCASKQNKSPVINNLRNIAFLRLKYSKYKQHTRGVPYKRARVVMVDMRNITLRVVDENFGRIERLEEINNRFRLLYGVSRARLRRSAFSFDYRIWFLVLNQNRCGRWLSICDAFFFFFFLNLVHYKFDVLRFSTIIGNIRLLSVKTKPVINGYCVYNSNAGIKYKYTPIQHKKRISIRLPMSEGGGAY